jgi:pristinamycin I synthase-3/4
VTSTAEGVRKASTGALLPFPADVSSSVSGEACVHRAFEAQARRSPGAVALVFGSRTVTYAELDGQGEAVARRLRAAGVTPDARVGVCVERGPALLAALLGAWKAGGAYVPLDPAYPRERLAYMAADAGLAALVVEDGTRDLVPDVTAPVVVLGDPAADERDAGAADVRTHVSPDNLAYVIYTSGSTGRPKGVMVPHGAVAGFLAAMRRAPGIDAGAALLAVTTAGFDISVLELFLPLTTGARVVLADRETAADGTRLRRLLERSGATVMQATPATWRMLLDAGWTPGPHLTLLSGGDVLPRDVAGALTARGAGLWNLYGPTETTVWSTLDRVEHGGSVTVGRAIDGTRTHVLDGGLRPVEGDAAGELFIGGAGVTRGYLGRPGLTAERFVPDLFSTVPGARMYRTGDGARQRPDGRLDFLGRLDAQVKVRGHRVEPGEVEAALAALPGVRQAVVVGREDGHGTRLVAYFVGDPQPAAELRAALRITLPEYMLPSAFVHLDALPLTASGKTDRRALPAPPPVGEETGEAYRAPRTGLEEALAEAWREVLGVARVGIDDDFFDMGGHSLLATRVLSRVRQRLGVELPVRALFEHPTVASLAAAVAAARETIGTAPQPPLVAAGRREPLPLSFSQQRLWFLAELEPDSPFYNLPAAVRLRGELSEAALRRALGEIVRRHEALRTVFRPGGDGAPVQEVRAAPDDFPLPVVDLRTFPPSEARAEALRLAAAEARAPFDLCRGPLLRALLVRVADREHVLVLTLHHIAGDAWSVGLLFAELGALYGAFREGAASPLAPLPVQYPDYAAWQRAWLSDQALEAQLAYWRARLEGAPARLELPTDRPRPPVQSHRGKVLPFDVSPELTRRLRALSRREDATPFMVLLAAFALVLQRLSGTDDLVVGAPVAGRTRPEVEGLIGFFVNTMALRVDAAGDPSFRELVRRVRETTLEAYAHQDLPFDRVVEELHPERTLGHNPLFQVALALQNVPRGSAEPAGLTLELEDVHSGTAKFDLFLELVEEGERLGARLEYATDLWEEEGARRIASLFVRLLDAAVAEPDASLAALGEVTAEERRDLLALGAGPAVDAGAADVPVHLLVAAQARARPAATAVRAGGRALSYAELDAAANRLAHHVRALGVGPDAVVGVCLERGADLVVAALAVLKAGGAYLPLDSALPPARIAAMLADAAAGVVVTVERLRDRVEDAASTVVSLDGDSEEIARRSDRDPGVAVSPESLAYVVFTSGSTGRPKGVAMPHRGLSNLVAWHLRAFGVRLEDRASVMAGVGFDASVWEVWPYLAAGAALHVVPDDTRLSPAELRAWLADEGVTVAFAPTPVAELLLDGDWPGPLSLRTLLAGGDRLHARPSAGLPFAVHNNYGPTEASVVATSGVVAPDGAELPDIGRAIAGARIYVVDEALRLVARGAPGELLVGGDGVARGYLGQPGLTADRFLPDPFSPEPGARVYRTGDRVRWRAGCTLEFLGRLDRQVKIRGHRIEPGEVEAVLAAHPGVAAAVVEPREGSAGTVLAAYVVPRRAAAAPDEQAPVAQWEALFENVYGAPGGAAEDEALDTTGWNSSYTGQPIPRTQMREWAERTAERIAALAPRRVLEVGVGTGMLLLRIAPSAERYVATDFSSRVLATLRRRVDAAHALPPVALLHREADDFSGLEAERFDTAILNSVCQYFPGAEYLARVVEGAVGRLDDGGAMFVGDVRNLETLEAFRTAVEFDSAPASATLAELRRRVRRVLEEEAELVVHPDFFAALVQRIPRPARAEVRVKRGRWHNELTRHRYDVVLRVGPPPIIEPAPSLDWGGDGLTIDAVRERVTAGGALAVLGVPNARVARELAIAALVLRDASAPETVGDARALLDSSPVHAVDPEVMWALGEEMGVEVEIRPAPGGRFDALFRPSTVPEASFPERPVRERPLREYANDPLWGQHVRELVPQLRAHLAERLPEHMVPPALVLLDALPLTPNGKTDRRALPDPEPVRLGAGTEMAPPRTETEREMAAMWAEVLRVETVYATDNFFDLGGHSLLATQLATRVRERFQVRLPLQRIFEAPTLAALSALVDEELATPRTSSPLADASPEHSEDGPRPRPRDGNEAPASFAQARLWVVDRLEPGGAFYTMSSPLRIRGALDVAALERALDAVRERHEALRTTFAERGGAPVQVIHPFAPVPLAVDDLSALAADEWEAEVERRVRADANTGFDLVAGPLFRARLLRLGVEEHVLLTCLHHIVSDGWSMGLLSAELGTLYEAFQAARPSPLPPLPVQYADFAAWQRERLSGEELERHLAFWRAALEGAPPALELPSDRPRPATPSHRGRLLKSRVPPDVSASLRALARREGATLFHVFLAGVRVLMGRWAGQSDVVIGTPVAGRTRRETEGLIGFFVNTLPLRGDLRGDPAFAELVRREREGAVAAIDHQDLPFERMVVELRVPRDPGRNPLFQVMAALQNARMDAARLAGVEIAPLEVEYDTAKFDLIFDAYEEEDGGIRLEVEYATDLFDAATVERMSASLHLLLAAAGTRPDAPAHALPLIEPGERTRLLSIDSTPVPVAATTVDALLAEQAERTPDAVALEAAGGRLTYRELHVRANRVAHRLRALGVGPESRVGVCAGRTVGMVAGLLGVLKVGAAYVPLDPAYPAERLAFMLADTAARVVLADASTAALVPAGVVVVRVDDPSLDELPSDAPAPLAHPENLAWVIFTSGSTGWPKGVMIRHASAAAFLAWMRAEFPLAPGERVLGATSVSFDVHVAEIHFALASGATLVLVRDALSLAEPGAAEGLAHAAMVPSAAAELLRMGALPAGLRTLVLGGEPLPAALARDVHAATGVQRLANGFGPTEDTTYSTVATVPLGAERITVGRPVGGGRAYVLDRRLEPVPVGVPGELWLAGAGLARGYLDRPALTAERFVPDPFSTVPGARMYRTGDRARRLASGELESLGRLDEQVKVRGFRIEPGEVEAALTTHPAVSRAVVAARGEGAGRRLVAYVVPRDGGVDVASLRAHAASLLPEHMVPGAWIELDALPLTPSGKVDRRALPEPDVAPTDAAREAPRTPTEEVLAAVFAEVLGVEAVGRDDGFFDLGGHSLLAAQVTSRVRAALQVDLPLREVFEAPSVAALAERVDAARRRLGGVPDAPIARVDRAGELPLSFAQERLWFIQRLQPESAAYNMPFVVRLDGALHVEALRRALEEVVRRHETLRTVFRAGARGPVQVVLPPSVDLPLLDASHLPPGEREEEAARWQAEEAIRPFDLAAAPPVRFALVRLHEREHRLLLTLHHVCADGWSLDRLFGEVGALYSAFSRGEPSPLPELPVQYADFAAWQRGWLRGDVLDRQLDYWKARLAGAPALELPADHPRPAVPSNRGAVHLVPLPPPTEEGLAALARREGATPFMALLAGFTVFLRRWTRQDDVVVGTPVAGRTRPEVEPLVGFFVNTVVLRADASGDPTFREVLARVRSVALDAYAHQDLPFERLVDELKVERQLSRQPVFQVVFSVQQPEPAPPAGPDLSMRVDFGDTGTTKFDLMVMVERRRDGAVLSLEYARDLFEPETVRRMGAHLAALLAAAATDPDAPVSALMERLDEHDRRAMLVDWNRSEAGTPRHPAHAAIEATASTSPDSVAVVDGLDAVAYGELNARANRLARHLCALGVGAESRVGIVASGSVATVEAMLAVLKAGGAYVPIDPRIPPARLRHVMGDAELGALIVPTASVLESLPRVVVPVVVLDRDAAQIAGYDSSDLGLGVDPDSLGAVVYSSGSTSLPRGVLLTHRAIDSAARATAGGWGITGDSRVLQVAPFAHERWLTATFAAFSSGAALVFARREELRDALERGRVTHAVAPPAVLASISASGLPELTAVVMTGEAPAAALVGRWARGGRTVHNAYTHAEAGLAVASALVDSKGGAPSVGRPIGGARLYVLDEALRLLSPGIAGELCVGGDGVARGYQGRPGLTAARFVPDSFADVPGARMVRTGDRARWRADGTLELLDRDEARVRGHRVEPRDVAGALAALPGIRHAVAMVRADASGGGRLVGYVSAMDGAEPQPEALRDALKDRLAEAMVPDVVVVLPEMPLTAGGRVDLRALPAPDLARAAAEPAVAPRGEMERVVAAVWQEVLGGPAVGVHDNFFEVGGHSLLLARLQERLEERLARPVRMVDLFRYPTVAAFAAFLGQSPAAAPQAAPKRGMDRGAARLEVLTRRGR